MLRFVKLLAVCPFSAAGNGVPSALNKSTRTVTLLELVFTTTISVDQPPFAANCGSRTAPGPPTFVAMVGNGPVVADKVVTGIVLKFEPRNRKPTRDTGLVDVIVSVPVKSFVAEGVPVNNSVMNFETC